MTQGEDEHGQQRHEQERQGDEQDHEFDDALFTHAGGAQLRRLDAGADGFDGADGAGLGADGFDGAYGSGSHCQRPALFSTAWLSSMTMATTMIIANASTCAKPCWLGSISLRMAPWIMSGTRIERWENRAAAVA